MFHIILKILILIHVFAAVAGVGPTFATPIMTNFAKNKEQIKLIYDLKNRLGFFPKYADYTLLVTGIFMMWISGIGLKLGWLNLALILFLMLRLTSSFFSPRSKAKKRLNELLLQIDQNKNLEEFMEIQKRYLLKFYYFPQSLVVIILYLMIWKPSLPFLSF